MQFRQELSAEEIAEGLTPQHDLFKKRQLALNVTALLERLEHGSVCLLDGRWGTGKSTFVKQWSAELQKMNVGSIYFDAFSSDYMESPFEAIAGTFVKAAIDAGRTNQEAYRSFLSRAAKVGKAIASVSAKVGVKAATLGAISTADLEELADVKDVLADGLGDITEEAVKKLLESHANRQSEFDSLKASLSRLPDLLAPDQEEKQSKFLVVFIDELDRCRPDFSLGVLEVLKHFFRSDRIHFVLVTNRDHLQTSVDRRYGSGSASSEYLEKFYDFRVYFEHSYERHSEDSVEQFVDVLMSKIIPHGIEESRTIRDYVRDISIAFRLTLRQIQSLCTNVSIAYLAARDREFRPAVLVTFLALTKTMRPDLYRSAKRGELKWQQIESFIKSVNWGKSNPDRVISIFRYHLDEELDSDSQEWRHYGEHLWNYNLDRKRVIPYLANNVLDRFAAPTGRGSS